MDSGKDWQSIWFWSNPVCQGEPCWAKWAPCSCYRHAVWCLLCEWTLANHSWPESYLSFSKPTDVRGRESKREELNAQLRTSWPTIYFWTLPQPSKPCSRWLAVSEGCLCGADVLTPQQNSCTLCPAGQGCCTVPAAIELLYNPSHHSHAASATCTRNY